MGQDNSTQSHPNSSGANTKDPAVPPDDVEITIHENESGMQPGHAMNVLSYVQDEMRNRSNPEHPANPSQSNDSEMPMVEIVQPVGHGNSRRNSAEIKETDLSESGGNHKKSTHVRNNTNDTDNSDSVIEITDNVSEKTLKKSDSVEEETRSADSGHSTLDKEEMETTGRRKSIKTAAEEEQDKITEAMESSVPTSMLQEMMSKLPDDCESSDSDDDAEIKEMTEANPDISPEQQLQLALGGPIPGEEAVDGAGLTPEVVTVEEAVKEDENLFSMFRGENGIGEKGLSALTNGLGHELRKQKRQTMYFLNSPDKRVDYIIAFEQKSVKDPRRLSFEKKLIKANLELEYENITNSSDGKHHYIKIHCPWEALINGAEILQLKKKLGIYKEAQYELNKEMKKQLDCCRICCYASKTQAFEEFDDYFTAPFEASMINIFDMPDQRTFFSNAERSQVARLFLDWTHYNAKVSPDEKGRVRDVGVDSLLRKGVYKAAYPLHEPLETKKTKDPDFFEGEDKDRQKLYHTWAHIRNTFKYQPLELIRSYFGEKVGLYFAWIGVYTVLLIPASLAGLAVFLYGLGTLSDNVVVRDICNTTEGQPGSWMMCPLCDKLCNYKPLSDSCLYAKLTQLVDNNATTFMAIFMAVWSLVYLEMWKRREKELQYDWDVGNFEAEETIRPEFQMLVKKRQKNPITQEMEPYVPGGEKALRLCTSITLCACLTALVCGSIFGVIVYRTMVTLLLQEATQNATLILKNTKIIITVTSAIINLIVITLLNWIYQLIAKALTNFERHRTQTAYEDAYTIKMIIFQFVNFYGSLFYIAFFKGQFVGPPDDTSNYLFGRRQDQCDPAGCFVELSIQLAIIMVGKQLMNNAYEYFVPFIINKIRQRDNLAKIDIYMRWEEDLDLEPVGQLALFYEYLEITIQFGFVTLFVAAFPLAPLFALINNLLEIRLDATKMTKLYQRKGAKRAQDIGAWYTIMRAVAHLSVVTNACIIAWTSDFLPKVIYMYTNDGTAVGYVQKTLFAYEISSLKENTLPDPKIFKINENMTHCWYRDVRAEAYQNNFGFVWSTTDFAGHSVESWMSFTIRLAFVVVFEHVCYLLIFIVTTLIPDVPARVHRMTRYERQLHHRIAYQNKYPQEYDPQDGEEEDWADIGGSGTDDDELDPGPRRRDLDNVDGKDNKKDKDKLDKDKIALDNDSGTTTV